MSKSNVWLKDDLPADLTLPERVAIERLSKLCQGWPPSLVLTRRDDGELMLYRERGCVHNEWLGSVAFPVFDEF